MSYVGNLGSVLFGNEHFRQVIFTGQKSQLVVMSLLPGEDIGEETHTHVEQVLTIAQGEGTVVLDGVETPIKASEVIIVTPGTRHNVVNGSGSPMKIATVYAPPNHIDGRIHMTKADAIADAQDEAFGETVT